MYPPSDVCWMERAQFQSLLSNVFAQEILPSGVSLRIRKSPPPVPATMYPPSDVCWMERAKSSQIPPKVFAQEISPLEVSLMIRKSSPPAPKDFVYPATMYPPSLVCWME